MLIALVRELDPGPTPAHSRSAGDSQRACIRREQQRLHATLGACGVHVVSVGATTELDAIRILAGMLVLPDVAFVAPALATCDSIEGRLARHRPIVPLGAPGLLDGRNVLLVGRRLFVGIPPGMCIDAVGDCVRFIAAWGYEMVPVVLRDCALLRHACSYVGRDTVLADGGRVDTHAFGELDVLSLDGAEPLAHSVLFAPPVAIASAPTTRSALALHGIPWASAPAPALARAKIALAELAVVIELPEHDAGEDSCSCVGVSHDSRV